MKTAFATGPGFYASDTSVACPSVPPGTLRIYCARIEAYDSPVDDPIGNDTSFELLVAKADGNPDLARALLQLAKALGGNMETLERFARRDGQ